MALTRVQKESILVGVLVGGLLIGTIMGYYIRIGVASYQERVAVNEASIALASHLPSRWLPGYSQDNSFSEEEVVPPRERTGQDANNPPVYVSQERLDNLIELRDETMTRDDNRPRDDK